MYAMTRSWLRDDIHIVAVVSNVYTFRYKLGDMCTYKNMKQTIMLIDAITSGLRIWLSNQGNAKDRKFIYDCNSFSTIHYCLHSSFEQSLQAENKKIHLTIKTQMMQFKQEGPKLLQTCMKQTHVIFHYFSIFLR